MIELGRSEEVILEMDRLASEDHSHIVTEEEIDAYRGNWWIRSNLVDSDTMPIGRTITLHGGNGTLLGGIPLMRLHHKDGLNTDRTGKPLIISESSIYLWNESHKEFGAQFTVIISVTANTVHCHRRCV